MIPIIEPIEAGLLVALISKLIINNPKFWEFIGCSTPEPEPEHEESSSNTTSVNDAELIHIHHFDPWMHT